ncbi:MAG TPA: vitamin K epoxide reductase family protein [Tabrizicola sp.]|nr:vitamin K epoxide reductase family protein [Tabrizicola sp.]
MTDVTPTELSRDLRTTVTPDLRRRRWIIGLSIVNAGIGALVGAYQTGLVRHLPDPPVGPFDADKVDASDYAYKRMQTPDGLLMMATFSATAVLAGMGSADRAEERPVVPLALAAKSQYDVGTAAKLAQEEWQTNKALCAWCQAASVLAVVTLALSLPEAARAARRLV